MHLHDRPIIVRYYGGFLDGYVSRSGDTRQGGYLQVWSARSFYFATGGQVGAIMRGVSPSQWRALKRARSTRDTIPLHHLYRVTASRIEQGRMFINAIYQVASQNEPSQAP
jgi:hypothetical protein